jgi:hypothetical protein
MIISGRRTGKQRRDGSIRRVIFLTFLKAGLMAGSLGVVSARDFQIVFAPRDECRSAKPCSCGE